MGGLQPGQDEGRDPVAGVTPAATPLLPGTMGPAAGKVRVGSPSPMVVDSRRALDLRFASRLLRRQFRGGALDGRVARGLLDDLADRRTAAGGNHGSCALEQGIRAMKAQPPSPHPQGLSDHDFDPSLHNGQADGVRLPRLPVGHTPADLPAQGTQEPPRARLQRYIFHHGDDMPRSRAGSGERRPGNPRTHLRRRTTTSKPRCVPR